MSDNTLTHQNAEGATAQLECEGASCFAPPAFQLSASPLQRQEEGGDTETTTATAATSLPESFDWEAAITYNNGKEFRLDWVRLLQQEMVGAQRSTDGTFDQETVEAIGRWQMQQWPDQTPDGKIGPQTRRQLESVFPSLLTTTLGTHLEPRILVPGDASEQQKYAYYRGIIESAGGVFLDQAMAYNMIGIRGVAVADGTDAHQVGGQTLAEGTLYQTDSARDFSTARAAGRSDDHFSGQHEGMNDMMVSLWIDGEGVVHVQERMGNVDPSESYNRDQYNTGHLRDGQYAYQVGTHGTRSRSHSAAVRGIDDPNNVLNVHTDGNGKTRYNALVPSRNQEVWRNHQRDDFSISADEEAASNERIYTRNTRYVNDNFAMNVHTSRDNRPNSQACQNIPAEHYLEFMNEVYDSSNQGNILYTLIDASKIDAGLQLVRQENRSE